VIGEEFLVQVLPGWHVKRGSFEAKVFWGPEYPHHHPSRRTIRAIDFVASPVFMLVTWTPSRHCA
jgi:hypothetical protein